VANELRRWANLCGGLVEDNPLAAAATTLTSAGLLALPAVAATEHYVIVFDPDGSHGGAPFAKRVTAHTAGATTATIEAAALWGTARDIPRDCPWVHTVVAEDLDLPVWSGYRTAASSPASATTLAVIALDTQAYDSHDLFDPATGRFTCTAEWAGLWQLTLYGSWASNATGIRFMGAQKNGSTFVAQAKFMAAPSGSTIVPATFDVLLAASDYLEWGQAQSSGGALALNVGSVNGCGMSGRFLRRMA
jgi:hypothetical protein